MWLISLAPLPDAARAELRELASGSKVPQLLLDRLLTWCGPKEAPPPPDGGPGSTPGG
jgi:hypothetical protein